MPDSTFKMIWDMFGMVIIAYQAIIIPFKLSFYDNFGIAMVVSDVFIDTYFLADIAISFNSGFYEAGILNTKRADLI